MIANELRIGNWVFCTSNSNPIEQVYSLGSEHNEINDLSEQEFDPIPLTPEILEKCGFALIGNLYILFPITLLIEPDEVKCWLDTKFGGLTGQLTTIKYLHQLQNLYFILSGEELEIKL